RVAEAKWRVLRHRLELLEKLFPWLEDYDDCDIDDLLAEAQRRAERGRSSSGEQAEDPVGFYVPKAEYERLSEAQRNQLALERYLSKPKTKWEIGRDYERFIGYRFERDGWSVNYHGIAEGLSDLGRDLIATKGRTTQIVQCKCWS